MKILNCIINLFFILTHGFWYIPVANDFIFARKRQGIERSLPSHISEEELAENWCKENEDWCEAKLYQKSESQFYRFFKKIKFDLKSVISTVIRSLKSACLQVYQVILTENIFLWTVFSVLWFETCGNVSWKYLLTKLIILMYARMELQTNLEGLIFICLGLVGILKSAILDAFVFMWLHIKKDDNFGICLFLQGAIRILLVKKHKVVSQSFLLYCQKMILHFTYMYLINSMFTLLTSNSAFIFRYGSLWVCLTSSMHRRSFSAGCHLLKGAKTHYVS